MMQTADPVSNYILYFFVLGFIALALHLLGIWKDAIRRRKFRRYREAEFQGRLYSLDEVDALVKEKMQER